MEWAYFRTINSELELILTEIRKCNSTLGLSGSPMIFPSSLAGKSGHLTSYAKYWTKVRKEIGLPDEKLGDLTEDFSTKEFQLRWSERLSEIFENMAEMSKRPT